MQPLFASKLLVVSSSVHMSNFCVFCYSAPWRQLVSENIYNFFLELYFLNEKDFMNTVWLVGKLAACLGSRLQRVWNSYNFSLVLKMKVQKEFFLQVKDEQGGKIWPKSLKNRELLFAALRSGLEEKDGAGVKVGGWMRLLVWTEPEQNSAALNRFTERIKDKSSRFGHLAST